MKRNYPEMDTELDRRDRVRRMKSPIDRRQPMRREPSPMMSNNNRGPPMSRDPYDDFPPPPPPRPKEREQHVYKILCVGNLNAKVNDTIIHDSLLREFNRFGDVSVKVCHDGNERFAYIYFRSYDEAREARHAKSRLILHDKQLEVEPIFERTIPSSTSNQRRRSSTPDYYNNNRPVITNQRTNNLRTNPQMSNSPRNQRGNMNQINQHQSSNPSMMKHHNNNQYQRNYNQNNNQMNNHHNNYNNNNLNRNNNLNHHNQMHHQNHMRNDNYHLNNQNNHHSNNQNNHINHGNQNHHMRPQRESKKDRFPNYLHHIPPEEDKDATRTLFVGNLEVTISDQDLKRIFEKYGSVEDIDVKRPPPGQGNAYAFIKFLNLDMAHRCKVEMSGQYIGKFQCKIGYGKCTPTTRLWVGGLGSWTSLQHLEREFDRFGAIRKIDFVKGDNHAYIQYDSIDAAQAACQEMRGHPLGGPDKRLRVDFADPEPYNYNLVGNTAPGTGPAGANPTTGNTISDNLRNNNSGLAIDSLPNAGGFQSSNPNTPLDSGAIANPSNEEWQEDGEENGLNKQYDNGLKSTTSPRNGQLNKRARTSDLVNEQGMTKKSRQSSLDDVESETTNLDRAANVIISENVTTIQELIKCCPVAWNGGLILKTMKFPARMLLCDGDISLVDSLLKDPNNEGPVLRITQRLRLDPIRLEDVSRRMSASGHCMLLTTQGSDKFNKAGGEDVRPIRNLVSYLKQKEAAGVVSLQANKEEGNDAQGVLYVFPPCTYASDLLKKVAPNLIVDLSKDSKDDYLVVIVVKGG